MALTMSLIPIAEVFAKPLSRWEDKAVGAFLPDSFAAKKPKIVLVFQPKTAAMQIRRAAIFKT
ncbi:hypothetical protein [Roseobacter sp. GAI101]|uniref:hypothetical protein n=1 Tax=Roseobacter sp. (strain GAI101) TaxID=391589 RepID=UPI000187198C|nr:hypothetical protein [Roseobacter sp. GAI101]EEB85846.1 hypothetical protein RGAI101_3001 [Roseobacter sp. GAI101]